MKERCVLLNEKFFKRINKRKDGKILKEIRQRKDENKKGKNIRLIKND